MEEKQLGGFEGVMGGWNQLIWIASLLVSARRWWKRLKIWKLVNLALFLKFLDGTIGRVKVADGCVN